MKSLGRTLRSPHVEVWGGVLFLVVGLTEFVEETLELVFPGPDVHHALILLGAITALRGVADVLEGAEQIAEGEISLGSEKPE